MIHKKRSMLVSTRQLVSTQTLNKQTRVQNCVPHLHTITSLSANITREEANGHQKPLQAPRAKRTQFHHRPHQNHPPSLHLILPPKALSTLPRPRLRPFILTFKGIRPCLALTNRSYWRHSKPGGANPRS
jgi:hypothetical protein